MPKGIKRIYHEITSNEEGINLAQAWGMPVDHVPSGTTYWPSGHVQTPPNKRRTMPKGQGYPPKHRKGGGFALTGMPSDTTMLAAVKIAEKNLAKKVGQNLGGMNTDIGSATSIPSTTDDNTFIYLVNGIRTGPAEFERRGNKATMKNVRVYGTMEHQMVPAGALKDTVGNVIRMVVVWDKSPNGLLPKFDDIFGGTAFDNTESTYFLDPKKFDNTSRFQILRDKRISSQPGAISTEVVGGGVANSFAFDEFIKLGDRETQYSASAGDAIGSMSTGGLYVIFRSQYDTGSTNFWVVTGSARLRYLP